MIKDITGNELHKNDPVHFTVYNSHRIRKGNIHDIDSKNVSVSYIGYGGNRNVIKMQLRFSDTRIARV